jgi:sugar phosphate isomerase/epimerase
VSPRPHQSKPAGAALPRPEHVDDGAAGSARSQTWPIGAALLQFPGALDDGSSLTDGPADGWRPALREVAAAGFDHVDLTDSWVRPGDLPVSRLDELTATAKEYDLTFSAISVTRRSVVAPDPHVAAANVDYSLRTVDAAAQLGVGLDPLGQPHGCSEEHRERFSWDAELMNEPMSLA